MSFDPDDEILQDFLVEAGEILETLGEQLIELEASPQDLDLLNAVFRGFHTIKGGAGFLAIDPLVNVCHQAEDVFNFLRQGERQVDAGLMDVVLQVLDVVNVMFDNVRGGAMPDAASPELFAAIAKYNCPDNGEAPAAEAPAVEAAPAVVAESAPVVDNSLSGGDTAPGGGDMTDDEFEALLDAMDDGAAAAAPAPVPEPATSNDEMTSDEFEALLDDIQGTPEPAAAPEPAVTSSSDEMSGDEFEALLDDIHGGAGPSGDATPVAEPVAAAPEPAPVVEAPPPAPEPVVAAPVVAKKEAPAKKEASKSASSETTVRVDTKRLDDIMNMVGELVLVRNRLDTLKSKMHDEQVAKAVSNLDVVTADLQLAVMKTRMQPIKKVFGRFPRVVRDLARNLKKEVNLELQGEETDLDKNLVEALADPLVHLVRNAVDHGVEMPDAREEKGKPRKGTIILAAEQEGDHIMLSIDDDGAGMNADFLRGKAVEKGIMDEEAASRLDDSEAYNLIFAPGFSTKEEISDVSGRGVGMDVVKTRIIQMNGTVEIDSIEGTGSKIIIKVPLTLAIMPTLMVKLEDQIFALPLTSVVEIFNMDLTHTNLVDNQPTILVRDHALPLFYLRDWLVQNGKPAADEETGHVVVVNAGRQRVGFVVDQLIGQEEVVIKPLGAVLHGLEGMAGATITGDGRIALILDVPGLMRKYAAMSQ
ncbi:MAG: chemotaxis protein CheA [Methylococcales bacterium]|jgi:two-component system, chemotaxis family, sensor kinase CheA|nr:chemotaxis protein CheA [Methylococcales bacterium]MBT7444999.1 chemotaxis protein CheA [Methylococcales bacterium]